MCAFGLGLGHTTDPTHQHQETKQQENITTITRINIGPNKFQETTIPPALESCVHQLEWDAFAASVDLVSEKANRTSLSQMALTAGLPLLGMVVLGTGLVLSVTTMGFSPLMIPVGLLVIGALAVCVHFRVSAQQEQHLKAIANDVSQKWQDVTVEYNKGHLCTCTRAPTRAYFEFSRCSLGDIEAPQKDDNEAVSSSSFGINSHQPLKEQREGLPVYRLKQELMEAIADHQILVVLGGSGSGKTTQITQYMVEALGLTAHSTTKRMIGCTQPHAAAAISAAKRVADEYGCALGEQVGYSTRSEDKTRSDTLIHYMTDGRLMREFLVDNDLQRYAAIVLDDVHERTVATDVLLGLLKVLCKRRPDLKIVVTGVSAMLDAEKISSYLFQCPCFTIPERTYPVEVFHASEPQTDYLEAALTTAMQIHLNQPAGDILIFLTCQQEIDACCSTLSSRIKASGELAPELIMLPVYSSLPSEIPSRVFEPAPRGARKCIVTSGVAEVSLSIHGIRYAVDSGFCNKKAYNPTMRTDTLIVTPASQASAKQRAGLAGKTGPGKCFRLYTEETLKTEMLAAEVPEIQRANLTNVVLQLKAMGINDLSGFGFMDPPPAATTAAATESLHALGALDEEGSLTPLGRTMAEFEGHSPF